MCYEQDEDNDAWGGINSAYGPALAMYAVAVGPAEFAREAGLELHVVRGG